MNYSSLYKPGDIFRTNLGIGTAIRSDLYNRYKKLFIIPDSKLYTSIMLNSTIMLLTSPKFDEILLCSFDFLCLNDYCSYHVAGLAKTTLRTFLSNKLNE